MTSSPRTAILATSERSRLGMPTARTVGSFVPALTQKAFEKFGFSTVALLTDWATIVGKDLAACTRPERIKWPRRDTLPSDGEHWTGGRPGACLILRVDPARALEVQYSAAQLIERINIFFGYRAVKDLRILQAPVEPLAKSKKESVAEAAPANTAAPRANRLRPQVPMVADEALRAALMRLQEGLARDLAGQEPCN